MGGRRVPWRDPVLARRHAVRRDGRADRARAALHDPRVRSQVQREHRVRGDADAAAGPLRDVLRVRDLGRLRAGEERHPAGARLLLPDAAAERRHLAHRGHAVGAARRVAVPAADAGHGSPARGAHARLAAGGARRVPRLRGHAGLDRRLPGAHARHPALQARLVSEKFRARLYEYFGHRLVPLTARGVAQIVILLKWLNFSFLID